jgi:hypothetical protein
MQKIIIMLSAVARSLDSKRRSIVKVVTADIAVGDGAS